VFKKAVIEQERQVNTYADLGHAARCLRQRQKRCRKGEKLPEGFNFNEKKLPEGLI